MSRAIHKARGGGYSFALVDTDSGPKATNSPTFEAMELGTPNGGRLLICVMCCNDNDDADDAAWWPATITIGGVTANLKSQKDGFSVALCVGAAVYSAIVPTGTTGDIAITVAFNGTMDDWLCALFRATGVAEEPIDSPDDATDDITLDTRGARFVVLGATDFTTTSNAAFTGGGNTVIVASLGLMLIGCDDSPLSGATDVYSVDVDADVFAGASYG